MNEINRYTHTHIQTKRDAAVLKASHPLAHAHTAHRRLQQRQKQKQQQQQPPQPTKHLLLLLCCGGDGGGFYSLLFRFAYA